VRVYILQMFTCPLGLPIKSSKDEWRVTLPLDEAYCSRLVAAVSPSETVCVCVYMNIYIYL